MVAGGEGGWRGPTASAMVSAAADSSQPAVASAAFLEGSEMHALRCSELRCSELLISGARGGISPISP